MTRHITSYFSATHQKQKEDRRERGRMVEQPHWCDDFVGNEGEITYHHAVLV